MWTWIFWRDSLERTIRTFCQTLAAVLGGSAMNIWTAGWHSAVGVAAGSAFLSFLMSIDRLSVTPRVDVTVQPEIPILEPSEPFVAALASPVRVGCGDNLR